MKDRADSERVSPTAYATGYFWYRHGLSHAGLLISEGRRIDRRFRLLGAVVKLVSGVSIDALMLARHKGIDALLSRHIASERVSQVVELAAGLSPRGWRFAQRHGGALDYLETDLPHMAKLKRDLLERSHLATPKHRVATVDVLKDGGADSLAAVAATLDRSRGLAIITEGLMSYLDPPAAQAVWRRIAATLKQFPHGVYLSDAYVQSDRYGVGGQVFRGAIQRFVKGRMHVHFQTPDDAQAQLTTAGFGSVTMHEPRHIAETRELGEVAGGNRVRVLEATVRPG
ncbi:MAG TPA: class I SAM-dependent methyltransferase [Verrucomicrobiae bacterium]|nr:class I SAM-dependent methyltransferase [Verrucomicrobiae bacterium]